MQDFQDDYEDDNVIILPADMSMLNKIGKANLDKVLSKEAIRNAQQIIVESAAGFYGHCLDQAALLEEAMHSLQSKPAQIDVFFRAAAPLCFTIKAFSGQAGYDLVSALAKSLLQVCENVDPIGITPAFLKIVEWHAESIRTLLIAKTEGDGGKMGAAILAEIERIQNQVR